MISSTKAFPRLHRNAPANIIPCGHGNRLLIPRNNAVTQAAHPAHNTAKNAPPFHNDNGIPIVIRIGESSSAPRNCHQPFP